MLDFKNYIISAPKRLYDTGASFVKNHPLLTLSTATLASAAVGAYFFSDLPSSIYNLPHSPLSVSSFSKPEGKIDYDKGWFFNKITTKIEVDQIETPTLYGQVVSFIKTGTFAAVEKTPQTLSLSERYEFSNLSNLLYYPAYSLTCAMAGTASLKATYGLEGNRNVAKDVAVILIGAAAGSFGLDILKEYFLRV